MKNFKSFSRQLDHPRVEAAIAAAERRTSGEIRVVLQSGPVDDPTTRAAKEFTRLKMHATAARNAVLFLVAPDARKFAVFGDEGVHRRCGDSFWREVAAAMESHFRAGDPTSALVEGIGRAGRLLAAEFPHRDDDVDELPNTIVDLPPDP